LERRIVYLFTKNESRKVVAEPEELNRCYYLIKRWVKVVANRDWYTYSDWVNSGLGVKYGPSFLGYTVNESQHLTNNTRWTGC